MTRDTTSDPSRNAPAEDFSLLRVATFLVRYRWLLFGLPALGFLLAAGWTALAEEPTHVASARVRAPTALDDALASAAERDGGGTEASLTLTRDTGVVEIRSSAATDRAALGRVRAALSAARDSLAEARASSGPGAGQTAGADGPEYPADSALAAAESAVAAYLEAHPDLILQEAVRDPTRLRGSNPATGGQAEGHFELAVRLARLDEARDGYAGEARALARSGAIPPQAAGRRHRTLRDSIRDWLDGRRNEQLSQGELSRYEALLWRLSLWGEVERTARTARGESRPPVEVLSGPAVVDVRRASAFGNGVVGLLLGALLGFTAALFLEAIRRGRERGDEDYREFREALTGLGWVPAGWRREDDQAGGPPEGS